MSATLALQKNQLLADKYRLARRLGFGAIGEVWIARNEATGRDVAIKFVRPRGRASGTIAAFERGVRESGKLRHPCVAELLDLFAIDGTPCVVTPLLEAEKLNALLARRGKLNVGASLRLVGELARALAYAHEHGVVHGRVAPANVLLHRDPRGQTTPILVDFGVARFVDPATPPTVETATSLEMFGELAYLSPEQAAFERDVDGRSDVWALGVLLHHCLVGEAPFRSRRLVELRAEIERPHPTPTEIDPTLDPEIGELCKRTLARARGSRISARDLGIRIDALLARITDEWAELAPDRRLSDRLDAKPLSPPHAEAAAALTTTPKPAAQLAASTTPKPSPTASRLATPTPGIAIERAQSPAPPPTAPATPVAAVTPSAPIAPVAAIAPPAAPTAPIAPAARIAPAAPTAPTAPARAIAPATPFIPIEIESSFLEAIPPRPPPRAIESASLFGAPAPERLRSGSPFDLPAIVAPSAAPPAATKLLALDDFDPEEEWERMRRSARRRRILGAVAIVIALGAAAAALVVRSLNEADKVRPEPTGEPLKLLPSKP